VRFSAAVEQAASAMPPISTAQEDWDANPWLLGTPGGVVDLRTGGLRDGEKSDMITKVTACTPSIMPDCPLWLAFLEYAMGGDDQLIHFIQRFCGYCLTGLTIEEVLLFLFGIAGSGKSTLVETLCGILGGYASTAPMEVFTGVSWSPTEYYRANMAGRRLIVAAEPERGAYWAEAFVKSITGGDKMSGRHPAGRPFDFEPTHKPLLHGNHMPRLRGRSTAMERRLLILLFNLKPETPDRQLKTKLRAEWPGILRWMIEGCLAWQRVGLNAPDSIRAANTQYFEAQDAFARWVDECCILDAIAEEPPGKLHKSFNTWARGNGEDEILSGQAFAEAIDQFESAPPLVRGRTMRGRFVRGIRLKPLATRRWSDADEPSP
jgi:putative DNA primase/helicase